jgi:hypothetical protein
VFYAGKPKGDSLGNTFKPEESMTFWAFYSIHPIAGTFALIVAAFTITYPIECIAKAIGKRRF